MTARPVPFATNAGTPMIVEVTSTAGEKYELRVGVVIVEVTEQEGKTNADGNQAFEIKAGLFIDTKKVTL